MKKKTIAVVATAISVMLMATVTGCTNKPAETKPSDTTTSVTETTKATEDTKDTTESGETTEGTESGETTEGTEDIKVDDTADDTVVTEETDANTGDTDDTVALETDTANPFGETVVEQASGLSLDSVAQNITTILSSGEYTLKITMQGQIGDTPITATADTVVSPTLGTYSNMDMIFIVMKTIKQPDGTLIIIDDANKNYIKTTEEESGMSSSVSTDKITFTAKDDVTTADYVTMPDNSECFRFRLVAANREDTENDMLIYVDKYTGLLTHICEIDSNTGAATLSDIVISDKADTSVFEIPADYTEITYEQYQQNMMAAYGADTE